MYDFFSESSFTLAVLWVKEASYINIVWTKCVKRVRWSIFCSWVELWLCEVSQYIQIGMLPREESLGTG